MIDLHGEVKLFDKDLPFDFDGNHIVIHMYNGEAAALLQQEIGPGMYTRVKNDLPSEIIEGTVMPERKKVVFTVDVKSYGVECGIDFEKADIIVFVQKYCLISSGKYGEGIYIESKQFHKMLGMIPYYNCNSVAEDLIGEITYNSSVMKQVGFFCIDDIECSINPSPSVTWGGTKFDFTPGLYIDVKGDLPADEWKIFETFNSLFKFFLMRKNIVIDNFSVYHNGEKRELHVNAGDIKPEPENLQRPFEIGGIPWEIAFGHFKFIFYDFFEEKVYTDFLYKNKKARLYFSKDTVSSDAAAFENIFDKIYTIEDVFKTSKPEAYNNVKDDLETKIKEKSGKEKEIYRTLLKILKPVTLENKIRFCFYNYEACFTRILKDGALRNPKHNFDEMAKICADTRNDIDHGNEGVDINEDMTESFAYLRALIYAMYLRKWDFTDDEIATSLYCLFSIEI